MKHRLLALLLLVVAVVPVTAAALKGFGNIKAPAGPKAPPRPVVVMPEGFVGKEKAVLTALFPDGITDSAAAPEGARLREARRWITDRTTLLAVLVDRWSGGLCETPTCDPQPTDLAVLEQKDGLLTVLGRMPSVGHHGGNANVFFDAEARRLKQDTTVIGVREEVLADSKKEATLRLFHIGSGELHGVFDRHVESSPVVKDQKRTSKPVGCFAQVHSDEFGTPPFAIKVVEHCTATGKGSTELWRWDGIGYRLHGPPSDAEQNDAEFMKQIDEPTR